MNTQIIKKERPKFFLDLSKVRVEVFKRMNPDADISKLNDVNEKSKQKHYLDKSIDIHKKYTQPLPMNPESFILNHHLPN